MKKRRQTTNDGFNQSRMTGGWHRSIGLLCLALTAAIAAPAQDQQPAPDAVVFKTLASFNGTNGTYPELGLVQGLDGNFYGTGFFGGDASNDGTVWKMTPDGTLTAIYTFCSLPNCTDGALPNQNGILALGTDGNFYGMAAGVGGANGDGTIFKITPSGTLTTLYNLTSFNEAASNGVIRGTDGNFYGSNPIGGNNIFKITPAGAYSVLYTFCSQPNCTDGTYPTNPLLSGADGNLYGTTVGGGANGYGTIFKLTPSGKLTTLHSFDTDVFGYEYCVNGYCAPMVQASNGNFYGTTSSGGTNFYAPLGAGAGTFFEITPAGAFRTLYNFCSQPNCADGALPEVFVQATDGNFYGVTSNGGSTDQGTLFKIDAAGTLTTLHNCGFGDCAYPTGLIQATNGTFYGVDVGGGCCNGGTVFSLSVGLGPFVETLPASAKAGATIKILGANLTGATAVSFNGVTAAFTVKSRTLISATVPTGATSGFVTVTTPSGTLQSNVKFHVRP